MINVSLDYYTKLRYDKLGTSDKFYKLITIDNVDDLNEFTKNEKLLKSYNKKLIDNQITKIMWRISWMRELKKMY